jgi:hypothetical protein
MNKNNKIDAVLINQLEMKRVSTNINDICSERDFYEDKDSSGKYIQRNHTENKFAKMEDAIAKEIDGLIKLLEDDKVAIKIDEMIKSGEWENISIWLMLHLTLVLIRLPSVKKIVYSNESLSNEIKQVFYKNLLWGKVEAEVLAEKLFNGRNFESIQYVIKNGENNGGINVLMNYLVNNYYVEIYRTPVEKKIYLIDNPVIINDITEIDYFLPLTPNYALVLKKITSNEIALRILPEATTRMVDELNTYLVHKADNLIIVQDMTDEDYEFILKHRLLWNKIENH